jgi:PKD repeat protein
MKKITFLSAVMLAIASNAQVTYTSANFAGAGEEFTVSKASSFTGMNFAATGANHNWDYSTLSAASQSTAGWQNPNGAGYKLSWCLSRLYLFNCNSQFNNNFTHSALMSDGFELMNYGVSNIVEHSRVNASSYANRMRGLTATVNNISLPMTVDYDDPDEIYQFPMNYNDSYTTTGHLNMDLNNLGMPFSYTLATERTNTVQGWGSLTTPMGVFPNVLKLKSKLVKTETYVYNGINIPITTTTVSYQWFSPDYGMPVLQADGFELFNIYIPTSVTYLDQQLCLTANADFAYLPVGNYDPDSQSATVPFVNLATNYNAVSWDFGDGGTSTEASPSHVYDCPGTYQVTMTVTNNACATASTDSVTLPVIVTDTQNALTLGITATETGLTADRDLPGTTYQWIDCDNANAPIDGETNQSFSPTANGNYACIINTNGCEGTSACTPFTLCLAATAEFTAPATVDYDGTSQSAVVLFANSSANYSDLSWDFGDGETLAGEVSAHVYHCPGVYTVTMTAVNNACSATSADTFTQEITVTDTQNAMTLNVTVTETGLVADRNLTGTTYQWIDCDNGNIGIGGETNQSFTPTVSGNYACVLNTNGCEGTSACVAFNVLQTNQFNSDQFELYPNPTNGELKLSGNLDIKNVAIYNALGMLVSEELNLSGKAAGVYFVKITANEGSFTKKVVKQ